MTDNLGFHQLLSILVIPSPVRISEGKISNGQLFVAPLVPHTALAGYFAARLQFATREQLRKEYTCVCQGRGKLPAEMSWIFLHDFEFSRFRFIFQKMQMHNIYLCMS